MTINKPAVGILLKSLDMGGAEKQSLLQAKLMSVEFDVYYFVQKKHPQIKQHIDFISCEKINFIQLSGNIISRAFQLLNHIKKKRIKVLFSFLTTDNFLAAIVSLLIKIKFVGGIRSNHLPTIHFYITLFLQKYFLDYIIFNNFSGKEIFVRKGFLPSKAIVIQNCINNIQDNFNRPEKKTIKILSVGRFTFEKDYLTALKAISYLKSKVHDVEIEYIIVGDGELYEQVQSWIKNLQVSNVSIVRNPDNIDDYYFEADIYLLSSIFEGMPNGIMEALNYSLPVVSTDVGDANYLVKDGANGYLVPIKDSQILAEKLFELVSDSNKRNTFGLKGHSLLINEFSERRFQEEYVLLTENLLNDKVNKLSEVLLFNEKRPFNQ